MHPAKVLLSHRSRETSTERLRTRCVQIAIPVLVRGRERDRSFEEETHSVSVNAYGGILRLSAQVALAQQILVVNPATASEVSGMVTCVGLMSAGKRDIN
jgi:hypothetical protein